MIGVRGRNEMPARREVIAIFCAWVGLLCEIVGTANSDLRLAIAGVFWAVMAVFHKLPWKAEQ